METQELYRGRLIDHLQLVVKDIDASKKFYKAVFQVLGIPLGGEGDDHFWYDELYVSTKDSPSAIGQFTGRHHLAFQAKDEKMVQSFYKVGLEVGGKDNGAPGIRKYHPGYYACFLIDPDGNNVEAVFHGKANRSTEAIKISF